MRKRSWCKRLGLRSLLFLFAGVWGSAAAQQVPNAPRNGGDEGARDGAGWQSELVFPVRPGELALDVLIADGRSDGIVRLYANLPMLSFGVVKEFAYDGAWTNTSNISVPFAAGAVVIGDGRTKAGAHVYAGPGANVGGDVLEYTWDGASWTGESIGSVEQQLLAAEIGDARGDASMHVYFAAGSSLPDFISHEFTYDGTGWTAVAIPPPAPEVRTGSSGLVVADGRNDGVQRLYQDVWGENFDNYVYELTWNGADWEALRISGPDGQLNGMAVGDAHKDGLNRLYVVRRSSGVREFTYDGDAWTQTADIAIGSDVRSVAIGDGRNDGVNRLYVASRSRPEVVEATFDGGTWQTAVVSTQVGGPAWSIRVSDGRGDGLQRVYSSGEGGVFEFTYERSISLNGLFPRREVE